VDCQPPPFVGALGSDIGAHFCVDRLGPCHGAYHDLGAHVGSGRLVVVYPGLGWLQRLHSRQNEAASGRLRKARAPFNDIFNCLNDRFRIERSKLVRRK
jgi:hypothetical protein